MTIKRCYPVLVGASVAENQLCNGESVTVPNGHKYYLKKSGTESTGASTGTAITGLTSGSDMVIDLTQMLGSAIADYAYNLEQATAGSGIAWLKSYGFLTDDYVPYNAGTIESVEASAKVVRDENGENTVTYPLENDVLRGIFKLDANNQIYAYGDTKTSDGTITRKYGIVDLSSITWYHYFSNRSTGKIEGIKLPQSNTVLGNYVSEKYTQIPASGSLSENGQYAVANFGSNNITFYYDGANEPSGYFVYELATPTTEQSTPFTSPQIVYPDGTEEFVTENKVPVGHETKYQL